MSEVNATIPVFSGELPILEHLLSAYYHQDAWEDASTNEEIWLLFTSEEQYTLLDMEREVNVLLAHTTEAIHTFVQEHADALYSAEEITSRTWAEALKSWLSVKMSNNSLEGDACKATRASS